MKRRILRISLIFILVFLISVTLLPQFIYADTQSDVSAFVTRFYSTCLNRMPDAGGLSSWVSGLFTGRVTGAQVANGFIFSEELLSENLSDEKFLNIMYSAFFNRQPDAGGFMNWRDVMANGANRQYVLAGFVNSLEFNMLCNSYGIRPVHLPLQAQILLQLLQVQHLQLILSKTACSILSMQSGHNMELPSFL